LVSRLPEATSHVPSACITGCRPAWWGGSLSKTQGMRLFLRNNQR
jgi:hypothetical protein